MDLRFNASHSGNRALVALAEGCEVGVDVEHLRGGFDLAALARRALSAAELEAWLSLPANRREASFYAAWTRKEAYAKGRGEGLGLGMERIEPRASTAGDRVTVADPDGVEPAWEVADVAVAPGYAGAVAARGRGWQLAVRRWPPGQ